MPKLTGFWCSALSFALMPGLVSSIAMQSAVAQGPAKMVAENVAAQNALFEEYYQNGLKNSPLRATGVGDYRYNDQLGDFSLAQIAREHAEGDAFLVRLRAIPTTGMGDKDLLSHELLERQIVRSDVNYELKNYEMPVNQQNGIHTELADLPLQVPLDSVKHYEDYIARLRQIPRALQQTMEVMRAGERDHLMPPKVIVDKLPGQCDGIIAANPFLLPTKKYPMSIPGAEQQRLTAEMTKVVNDEVFPAYRAFAKFLREEYDPQGRVSLSIESLPDGKRRYAEAVKSMTTIDITPAEVHALGLSEVKRITAEMTALAKAQGYPDLASFRAAINSDPKWKPTSEAQIVADFKHYIDQMEPKLPELFNLLPKAPVTVEAIPDFDAAAATHYVRGTPDGRRPGRVVVAVADPTHRTLVLDEAVAYHEGVPGHHLQISVAQQLTGLPKFRLHSGYSAYTEGWALYAEQLGKEIGFYQNPVSDYGRLNSELFRAVRLVVDTGIHDQGWTRQQVIDYMHANDVNDVLAQSETDRYIAWPGQALAYKMGQLKILELRARAKKELGPKFDIKAFHDEILDGGALPLDLLETRVDAWIKVQAGKS
ncbi:DUF885 domain-containing protein [Granulicella sp. 5B5]|uniref:DUF885 domain-containing protein n=1 Tax=Granulicella sp. 5B5 TaxID=1617967 RepID=UPI0021026443|nr:DUF885 domain-containing protein [Granulicella sp. 5B5]